MGTTEMATIAAMIAAALRDHADESVLASVRKQAADLCAAFPAYPARVSNAD